MVAMPEIIHFLDYQQDGYTNQGLDLFFKNPKGTMYKRKSDAYYQIKYGKSFIEKLKRAIMFYTWQSVLKIKDVAPNLKIKFPYNFLGKLLKIFFVRKYRNKYKSFLGSRNFGR